LTPEQWVALVQWRNEDRKDDKDKDKDNWKAITIFYWPAPNECLSLSQISQQKLSYPEKYYRIYIALIWNEGFSIHTVTIVE
jgi:hypothetical protein